MAMETKDVINIALTVYGLIISSYLCLTEIKERKRKFNFSHNFKTSFGDGNQPKIFLKLYVNNGSDKLLELAEIRAFSKTGSIPIEQGDPKIA